MEPKIAKLASDFQDQRGPFSVDNFPEVRLVEELGDEQKVEYLSMFCSLDYNRGVDQLLDNIIELSEREQDYFYPPGVVKLSEDELQSVFTEIGFRYGNRDARGWQTNCRIITHDFGSTWYDLVAASGYHAPTMMKLLREYDFMFLKGEKLGPFYCRVINDLVEPLDGVWQLPIPVDTHIRKLTQELLRQDMTDDEIREFWREWGQENDASPAIVDGGLWMIGYQWEEWGQDYFIELTGRETFKYL